MKVTTKHTFKISNIEIEYTVQSENLFEGPPRTVRVGDEPKEDPYEGLFKGLTNSLKQIIGDPEPNAETKEEPKDECAEKVSSKK